MVLILALERQDPEAKKEGGGKVVQYSFYIHSENVAVAYDSSGEKPTDEEVEAALAVATTNETREMPPFFVTPYELFMDNSEGETPKATMEKLLAEVTKGVNKRENTTLIDRGSGSEDHLAYTLISVLEAVKTPAEYAMQMVADEIAKEKQMQRLLQLENDGVVDDDGRGNPSKGGDAASDGDGENACRKPKNLPISKKLKEELKRLQRDHPYGAAVSGRAAPTSGRAAPSSGRSVTSRGKQSTVNADGISTAYNNQHTLLCAASGDDLVPPCKDGSYLVPTSFLLNPPLRSHGRSAAMSVVRERSHRSHSHQYAQQKRKSTVTLLSELRTTHADEDTEPIKGNGWGSDLILYQFDGEESVMAVPGVPRFEDVVKCFSVDFWIRTDCTAADGKRLIIQIADGQREDLGQLFQVGLNWYEDMEESIRLFFRDSANRVLEALIPTRPLGLLDEGKEFHHVMIHVRSLDEGTLECVVDGTPAAIQLVQQEHPIGFNPWPHRLFIGGCLNEENNPVMVLRGSVMELRFFSGGENPKPIVRWPLLVDDGGKLVELTRTIPADHHETLLHLRQLEEKAPNSAPCFDGNLVMNVGTMPLWGELMHNWRIEIRFRTDISTRMMTLVGVTDQKFKMQELGIVLNAEPVPSKERYRFHEFNTTFYLIDAFGACCSALLRGTERQNLMDGQWHTLVWKCVDSESNKFTVKVDGIRQDLLFVTREGPRRFVEMEDWVCVGGHNVRNWKVKRIFDGYISRFFVTLRGHYYATITMNEGPGAHVLTDKSGHRNHGLLISPETNIVRRNDITWIPAKDEVDEEEENAGDQQAVVMYKNNHVSVAAVVFTCLFDEVGMPQEAIYDIFHKAHFEPETIDHAFFEAKPMWGTWQTLPSECFKPLETLNQLEESINTVLQDFNSAPRGHLMVVIRVGDCHITFLHLLEPEMPPEATFNMHMLKWQYPFTIEGIHGRRELVLNRMIESLEGVLLNDSLKPFITARLGPLNLLPNRATLLSKEIVGALQSSGMPWHLAGVMHTLLLHAEYGSHLHIIHRAVPTMTFGQAASLSLLNRRLLEAAQEKASIIIQRNWKIVMAKKEAGIREEVRQYRDRKVEEIRVFRMNPIVQAKQSLYALLVTLHDTACECLQPIHEDAAVNELEDLLTKQGYFVERLSNPSSPALLKAISQIDAEKSSFIYISGYGGQINIRQPPMLSLQALHLSLEEGAARARMEAEAGATLRATVARCKTEALEVKSSKRKKKKKGDKKPAPPVKRMSPEEQEMQARQLEAIFHAAQMDVEQEEAFVRDGWMQEYEGEAQAISREMRQTLLATREYEKKYKAPPASSDGHGGSPVMDEESALAAGLHRDFIFPCESKAIDPYASLVLVVEDLVRTALRRQVSPIGLQSVIAVDLQPVAANGRGYACLASSTGNTLRMPYKVQQQRLLTTALCNAFIGDFPALPATNKYTVLTGGIKTAENQRDWKSLAKYVIGLMRPACTPVRVQSLYEELDRELPFTAELIPIRDVALTPEAIDRRMRDKEAQKANVTVTFGVGSTKVQSDMFALFKNILEGLPLSEIVFTNTIHIIFSESNKGIDGIVLTHLIAEIEKCRPLECTVSFECSYSGDGGVVRFELADSSQRLSLMQWINAIVVRSLSWQIARNPIEGYRKLDVDYVEYVYTVKTTCHMRRYDALLQQRYTHPVPEQYLRFLNVEVAKGK